MLCYCYVEIKSRAVWSHVPSMPHRSHTYLGYQLSGRFCTLDSLPCSAVGRTAVRSRRIASAHCVLMPLLFRSRMRFLSICCGSAYRCSFPVRSPAFKKCFPTNPFALLVPLACSSVGFCLSIRVGLLPLCHCSPPARKGFFVMRCCVFPDMRQCVL